MGEPEKSKQETSGSQQKGEPVKKIKAEQVNLFESSSPKAESSEGTLGKESSTEENSEEEIRRSSSQESKDDKGDDDTLSVGKSIEWTI